MTLNEGPDLQRDGVRNGRGHEQYWTFAPDALVGVAPDGRIELVNAQAELLFGYGREQLVGEFVEILVPERFRAEHSAHRAAYFANPRAGPMEGAIELLGRRRDGNEFPAEISVSSVGRENGTLAMVAVRDVSRLDSVGQLAAGIAHDFNNLLGVILNSAAFVAEDLDEGSPSQADVEVIRHSAQRAAALTRELLIFSRRDVVRPQSLGRE